MKLNVRVLSDVRCIAVHESLIALAQLERHDTFGSSTSPSTSQAHLQGVAGQCMLQAHSRPAYRHLILSSCSVTVQHIGIYTTHAVVGTDQAAVFLVGWKDACLKQAAAAPRDTPGQDKVHEVA